MQAQQDSAFKKCAKIQEHMECLREFVRTWSTAQEKHLLEIAYQLEQYQSCSSTDNTETMQALEGERARCDAPFHLTDEPHCCKALVDRDCLEEAICEETQLHRKRCAAGPENSTKDCECLQLPAKLLQVQGTHTTVRTSNISLTPMGSFCTSPDAQQRVISSIRSQKRASINDRWSCPPHADRQLMNALAELRDNNRASNDSMQQPPSMSAEKYELLQRKLTQQYENDIVDDACDDESQTMQAMQARKSYFSHRLVLGNSFAAFGGFMIIAHAVLIGVQTEYEARTLDSLPWGATITQALSFWYALEAALRLYVLRLAYFCGPQARWNMLDMFLVVVSGLDVVFSTKDLSENQSMGRTLRGLRLLRLIRNVRLFRFFNVFYDFQRMTVALTSCMGTLFWSVLMLVCVTWTFAVVFTQFVSSLRRQVESNTLNEELLPEVSQLCSYFQDSSRAMHCLIQSCTGGNNWGAVSALLFSFENSMGTLYLFYIFLTVFGVLNVVTSVFVESALQTSQDYRELLVEQRKRHKDKYASHVRDIFHVIDKNNSGLVSLREIEDIFADPNLRTFIDALELNASDAIMLFNLVDYDGSGEISIDEFCDGCLKLKGEAKSFDVYCLIYHSERNLRYTKGVMSALSEIVKSLSSQVEFLNRATSVRSIDEPQTRLESNQGDVDADGFFDEPASGNFESLDVESIIKGSIAVNPMPSAVTSPR